MNTTNPGRKFLESIVPPLLLFAVVVVVWHACVLGFHLKPYVLPAPLAVAKALVNDRAILVRAVGYTGSAALCGFTRLL